MNYFIFVAGVLSFAVALLHTFAGGKTIARPLLDNTAIQPGVKYVMYYCWHIVTFVLFAMAGLYFTAALIPQLFAFAYVAFTCSFACALLGIAMAPAMNVKYKILPQGWLFVPIVLISSFGLFG